MTVSIIFLLVGFLVGYYTGLILMAYCDYKEGKLWTRDVETVKD